MLVRTATLVEIDMPVEIDISVETDTLVVIVIPVKIVRLVAINVVETDLPAEIGIVVIKETVENAILVAIDPEMVEVVVIVTTCGNDEIVGTAIELESDQEVQEDLVVLLGVDWIEIGMIVINALDRSLEVDETETNILEIMIGREKKMVKENVVINSKILCQKD